MTAAVIRDQSMQSMADAIRFVPGATMGQGEGHRDAPTIRGNSSTADFFVDGIRDDAQYFRDFYNVERIEALGGANAMIFGRGGGGGVINRVTKQADWGAQRDLVLEGGSFGHGRGTLDAGGPLGSALAVRLNGMYQHSLSFRDAVSLSRVGVNPSTAIRVGRRSVLRVNGEYLEDHRTVDRGLPSFRGAPANVPVQMFFGNPDSSYSRMQVGSGGVTLEQPAGDRLSFRTHARVTAYAKFYQNVYPGAMNAAGSRVSLSAYNNDTRRLNTFGQTEATLRLATGMPQTILVGVEIGQQNTDNLRLTGYFGGTATSLSVPIDAPTDATPVQFRAGTSDADSRVVAKVASVYAQDQVSLTPKMQATLGARLEQFDLRFRDRRSAQRLSRSDRLLSPRLGVVYRPVDPVSVYGSVSVSHLPSSGDQFSGLTPTTQTLEPERFVNQEIGAKWDVARELALTSAVYRLIRTNAAAPSALDPGITVQTGKQRTTGYELSFNGRLAQRWDVVGAFASQQARIVSRTASAPPGATVPLVPKNTFSFWNRLQAVRWLGFGLGAVHQSRMFAAIDNAVTLPGFWRLDGAAFATGFQNVKLQANVENVLNRRYYATSHGNNNIMPGSPRTVRVSLTTQIR